MTDMSNSIETPIDIDFFAGIDIGIDIDFLKFERLTLTFLSSMPIGNQNPSKLSF